MVLINIRIVCIYFILVFRVSSKEYLQFLCIQASNGAQIYCTGSVQSPPRERARGKFNLGSLKMKQEAQKILNMEKEKTARLKHLDESEVKALSKAKEGL